MPHPDVGARNEPGERGGEIVFFYHDSDHDARETQTILRHRKTDEPATLNFAFENKVQRKWSPLFLKRIAAGWQANTAELNLEVTGAQVDARGFVLVDPYLRTTAPHVYAQPGRYQVAVKVIDIFGNDTMTLLPVSVG